MSHLSAICEDSEEEKWYRKRDAIIIKFMGMPDGIKRYNHDMYFRKVVDAVAHGKSVYEIIDLLLASNEDCYEKIKKLITEWPSFYKIPDL